MNNTWYNVKLFEKIIANYTGSKYCVAVDSCTNAIFLSLMYNTYINKNISEKIIIPERTYISIPMQIKNAGKYPILKNIKWKGQYKLGNTNIIDSAQNFNKNIYEKNSLQCLSFQYKKHLPIGRGGAILTDNKNAYLWLLEARHDGRNMYNNFGKIKNVKSTGWHCPMLPHEACIGIELFYNRNLTNQNTLGSYLDYEIINKNLFI
jgi:dTDP-4-amino-4,6-dideoxygalactose transaminase